MRVLVQALLLVLCSTLPVRAQSAVDSLEVLLPATASPERLAVLTDLVDAAHRDDPDRAIAYGREALALLTRYPDGNHRRDVLHSMGQAHLMAHRHDSVQVYVSRLATLDSPLDRARARLLEGWLHLQRRDNAEAEAAFTEALGLMESAGYQPGIASVHYGLGEIYRRSDYDRADQHFEQALALYQALGDRYHTARVLNALGITQRARGAADKALDHHFRALSITEALGERSGTAYILNSLAIAHSTMSEWDEALPFYERALSLYEELGDPVNAITSINGIANYRKRQGDLDGALELYTRALAAAEETAAKRLTAVTLINIGGLQGELAYYEAAEQTLQRALALYRELGDRSWAANTMYSLSRIYREHGRLPEALATMDRVLAIADSIGNLRLVEAAHRERTDMLERQGRHVEALAAHRAFKAMSDSLRSARREEAIEELQAEYQTEQQQQQIELLEQEQRTQRTRVLALLAGLAGLALIIALLVRQTRLRRRALAAVEQAQRLTEEKAAELGRANEKLAQADAAKTRFFTNVSHEFRTPLTLTIGPLEDLQDGTHGALPAPAEESVALALGNSRRLLRLINQLLDVAKLDAGELKLDRQPLALSPFVEAVALAFVPLAERRRITFAYDLPDVPVVVSADSEALEQVLVNLLSNAFKFTPEDGTVTLALETDGGEARIAVTDTGPGIAEDVVPHLFERFYQTDESHSDVQAGTGVGLALARDLTELHGGTITVESTPGRGSRFTASLPLIDAEARPATPTLALAPDTFFADAPTNGEADGEDASVEDRTTVLVVDDNADIRRYVRSHLEPAYRVLEAADGQAGVEIAREYLPDCIVSDVMMPRLDGFGLVRALRSDEATDFLPIILLTAKATEEDKLGGLGEGADDYLTKPFNVRELQARVENLITQRQRLRVRFSGGGVPSGDGILTPEPPDAPTLGTADAEFLDAVRAAAQEALGDEDYTVEALAEAVGQSRSNLHRRLKEIADVTPTAFIREVRLAHAAGLLAEGAGTVSEVAYGVGFKSVSHFSRAFSTHYGVAPSGYRA